MQYIYAAMTLHEAGRDISESNLTSMLDVVGAEVNESRVKALVAALEDVDIEEALETAVTAPVVSPTSSDPSVEDEPEEESVAEDSEDEPTPPASDGLDDSSSDGLGALFG